MNLVAIDRWAADRDRSIWVLESADRQKMRSTYSITPKDWTELKRRIKMWDIFSAGINRILTPRP